jgi:hypothetical protein
VQSSGDIGPHSSIKPLLAYFSGAYINLYNIMQQASGDGDCTFNVRIACYATVLHSCNYTCGCDAYNAARRADCSAHCCTTFQTQGHRSLRRRCNCGAHKMGYFRVLSLIETGYSTGMLIFITLRRGLLHKTLHN